MNVDVFNLITGTSALLAIAIAVAASVPAISTRSISNPRSALTVALAVAAASTLGSLTYSGYFGYEPCRLCWYQRIAMYPLVWLLAVAVARGREHVSWYVIPPAVAGLATSVYHYLLQWVPSIGGSASCSLEAPCSVRWVEQFGFISIPFMAGSGFLAIIALTLLARRLEPS